MCTDEIPLPGLVIARRVLADSLTERGIDQWLHARNLYLRGERPVDLLAQGKGPLVVEAAKAFADGTYL